jgi:putative hydrolase of the HAD superfamily
MIRAIIFDLDMCILDTRSLTGPFFDPILEPLQASELPAELKEKVERALWTTSLDDTAKQYSLPSALLEKMRTAYQDIEVPEGIRTFGDELALTFMPVAKILVTSGYRRFQESKIEKLGIAVLFDEVIIDATDVPDERLGKRRIFEELLEKHGWAPDEVLVVGDNPISELGAAKSLGIRTVQTLRPTIEKWAGADHHVYSLFELNTFI